MKRKITEFEQYLIDNGWVLTHKSYTGKLAKRVLSYTYESFKQGYFFELVLKPKRNEMIDLKIKLNFQYVVGYKDIESMVNAYDLVFQEIKKELDKCHKE